MYLPHAFMPTVYEYHARKFEYVPVRDNSKLLNKIKVAKSWIVTPNLYFIVIVCVRVQTHEFVIHASLLF